MERITKKIYIYSDANERIEIFAANYQAIDLSSMDLHRAYLVGKCLKGSKCIKTDFRSASLQYADFSECDLQKSRFTFAECEGVKFHNTDVRKCLFNFCDLKRADFSNANMKDMILAGSNLHGAKLLGSNIDTVIFDGAKYNDETIWPINFNPIEYGATKTDETSYGDFQKEELIKLSDEHIEFLSSKYVEPTYKKYSEGDMNISAAHPSWIKDKIIHGLKKGRLYDSKPNKENYIEYGFDNQFKCLYETNFYDYGNRQEKIYEYNHSKQKVVYSEFINPTFLETYQYDENGRLLSIEEQNLLRRKVSYSEKYHWLDKDVATIEVEISNIKDYYLLIKNKEKVLLILKLVDQKGGNEINHNLTDGSDTLGLKDNITFKNKQKILHPNLDIIYENNNDDSQYFYLNVLGKIYIGIITYQN